jgi:hypothetical protein
VGDVAKSAVRAGKSKANINASIIRKIVTAQAAKDFEQPDAPRSINPSDPKGKGSIQQPPVEPSLQDLSLGPNPVPGSGELAQIRTLLQPPSTPGVENFGIPPPSGDEVDPELAVSSPFIFLLVLGPTPALL